MNSILLISDDMAKFREVKNAVTNAAPECEIVWAVKRADVDAAIQPAVILLDLTMASEPAIDILRWLRKERAFRQVPIFVLGSEALKNQIQEAYSLGANSCLSLSHGPRSFEPIAGSIATYASLISGGFSPACA